MANYFKTSDNKIYKYNNISDYYLLCTPWDKGENRRKTKEELINPVNINKNIAKFEINEIWRNSVNRWTYNGKIYESCGKVYDEKIKVERSITLQNNEVYTYEYTSYTNLFALCPKHSFKHKFKNKKIYTNDYYLCMYQGHLVWVQISQYIPRVYYYKFENIDTEPNVCGYGGWTNINCLKPIFCVTDKKYI